MSPILVKRFNKMSTEKKPNYPSTFTLDYNSTTTLATHEVKVPIDNKGSSNEKNYDPFEHRQVEHANSTVGSLIHLLKSSLGTGILAMPLAFKNGGLVFAFVGTIVVGMLCTHCVHILVRASHEICRRSKTPMMGFSETAGAVFQYGPKPLQKFANTASITVDAALIFTYFMGNGVYTVFICKSIKQLVDYYYPELQWSILIYMCIVLVPLVISCQIRELKYLVPFSFLANIFMVISFGITLYYMFRDLDVSKVEDRDMVAPYTQWPLFFSTVIFAMEGIGVVMPVENTMKNPQHFLGCPGVLNCAMGTVVTLYAIIGLFGYMVYGNDTKGSITFNLDVTEIAAQVVQALIALAVFFTYSLQFYVPMDITWKKLLEPKIPKHLHNVSQITFRTLSVAATVAIAAAVPNLEAIIGLVGSICFSMLGIFIPAVVDIVLRWNNDFGKFKWMLYKNIFLGVFAWFALIAGTYQSILAFEGGE